MTTRVTDPVTYWLGVLVDRTLAGGLLVQASRGAHRTWVAIPQVCGLHHHDQRAA